MIALFVALQVDRIERARENPADWARAVREEIVRQAEAWVAVPLPYPEGATGWAHNYYCADHGVFLRYDPARPTEHVCPRDGAVRTGADLDAYWVTTTHDRRANAAYMCALASRWTDDSKYSDAALAILRENAAHYRPRLLWHDLGEATWLIPQTQTYMALRAQDAEIEDGLLRPAAEYLARHRMGIHNIQCWMNAAVGLVGLAISDNQLVSQASYARGIGRVYQLDRGILADGWWFEGSPGYHFYALRPLMILEIALADAGRPLDFELFRSMFRAPIEAADAEGRIPPTNDAGMVTLDSVASLYEMGGALFPDDPSIRGYLGRYRRNDLSRLLYGMPEPHRQFPAPASLVHPDVGYAILRGGGTYVLLDVGPHGGGHGHFDQLNIAIHGLGRILVPDLGTAGYGLEITNWYRSSFAHNVVLVDGRSQRAGKPEARWDVEGERPWVEATTTSAYSGVAWTRTAMLLPSGVLVLWDEIEAGRERRFDWVMRGHGRLPGGGEAVEIGLERFADGRRLAGSEARWTFDDGAALHVAWEGDALASKTPGNPLDERLDTLVLRRTGATARFRVVLQPLAAGAEPAPVEFRGEEVIVGGEVARRPTR